jgi:hypothetical protein
MDHKDKLEILTQSAAILEAMIALTELGAPQEKIEPLKKTVILFLDDLDQSEAVNGKKPMRLSRRVALAAFAAAVTILKRENGVEAAIAGVAVPHGVDRKEIKNFRDRLNRGRTDLMSDHMYRSYLADYESMTTAEIMVDLEKLVKGGLCT